MPDDPFAQKPVSRPGSGGRQARPSINPVSAAMRRPSAPLVEQKQDQIALDPRLAGLQIVAIDRIRPGEYQFRDELDEANDQEYLDLRARILASLEKQPGEEKILEHVWKVAPEPGNNYYLNPIFGGHRRLQICKEAGVKHAIVWIKEYDEDDMAIGNYDENKGRKDTSLLEDARLFRALKERRKWTQEAIAQRLGVRGGRDHVARCVLLLDYAPDIQEMASRDPERGIRAAGELARLDKHFPPEKAKELRVPLIAGFYHEDSKKRYTTDMLKLKVDKLILDRDAIMAGETKEEPMATPIQDEILKRLARAVDSRKRFALYLKSLGDQPPWPDERAELESLRREIDEVLARS